LVRRLKVGKLIPRALPFFESKRGYTVENMGRWCEEKWVSKMAKRRVSNSAVTPFVG